MIIQNEASVINNSNLQAKNFDVEENSVLFWVMSNALYTYKERAVLRELGANGWDAHKAIGKEDVPIRIKLPTNIEPELVFQDFGIGMDRKTLEDYYFAYFKSTKRQDNNSIGGFGVGCKTPFILSQTYSIETVHKGIKNVAIAVLVDGIPQAMYISEAKTTEPDGTIIRIPVSDPVVMKELEKESYNLFINWPVKPIITKGMVGEYNQKPSNYTSYSKNIYLSKQFYFGVTQYTEYFNKVTIGMFEYELPATLKNKVIDKLLSESLEFKDKLHSAYRLLGSFSINFYSDIGTIKLSPSRETIEDTTDNVNVILKLFVSSIEEILTVVKEKSEKLLDSYLELFSTPIDTFEDYVKKVENIKKDYSTDFLYVTNQYIHSNEKEFENDKRIKKIKENTLAKSLLSNYNNDNFRGNVFLDYVTVLRSFISYGSEYYSITRNRKGINKYKSSTSYNIHTILYDNKYIDGTTQYYILNSIPSNIVKYLNHHDTDIITIDGVNIGYHQIIGVNAKNPSLYNLLKTQLGGLVKELDISSLDIPKTIRSSTQTTKVSDTPVFKVLADNTGTFTNDIDKVFSNKEWYNYTFDKNVTFIVFNQKSVDYHTTWTKIFNDNRLQYVKKPIIVIEAIKNSEFNTKRYEEFSKVYSVQQICKTSEVNIELQEEIFNTMYTDYLPLISKMYKLKPIFSRYYYPSVTITDTNDIKLSYQFERKYGYLRVVKDLIGIKDFKNLVRFLQKVKNVTTFKNFKFTLQNVYLFLFKEKQEFLDEEKSSFTKDIATQGTLSGTDEVIIWQELLGNRFNINKHYLAVSYYKQNSALREQFKQYINN